MPHEKFMPNQSVEQPQEEKYGNFNPPNEMTLGEDRAPFIKKKLAQYENRVEEAEERIQFTAPELISEFYLYYDALAKQAAAQLLLGGETVSREEVSAFVTNSAREHWDATYPEDPQAVERILKEHQGAIGEAVKQGWGVLSAYNGGKMHVVRGNEPVPGLS